MVAAGLTVVLVFPWDLAADWRGLLAAEIALLLLPPGTNFLSYYFHTFHTNLTTSWGEIIFILLVSGEFTCCFHSSRRKHLWVLSRKMKRGSYP